MKFSDQLDQIAAAMAKAQGEFASPEQNRTVVVQPKDGGRSYEFAYSTLDNVIKSVRGPLAANGLWFTQDVEEVDGKDEHGNPVIVPYLETCIMHASGQWMRGRIKLRFEKLTNQGVGSAISYMRRYALLSALGIASDFEDDDGNAADGNRASNKADPNTLTPVGAQQRQPAPRSAPAATNWNRDENPAPPEKPKPALVPSPPAGWTKEADNAALTSLAALVGKEFATKIWTCYTAKHFLPNSTTIDEARGLAQREQRLRLMLDLVTAHETIKGKLGKGEADDILRCEVDAHHGQHREINLARCESLRKRMALQANGEDPGPVTV